MNLLKLFRRKPKQKRWVTTDQGLMDTNWDPGWWQQHLQPGSGGGMNEVVESCVSALSQTLAMCPVDHLQIQTDGEARRLFGSGPERALLNPNEYTSRSLFFNQLIRSVYFYGNGYALATRDGNRAINGFINLDPRNTNGVVDPETGDVYYWVSANAGRTYNPDTDSVHPARDILNIRLFPDSKEPLKGETPITAAANSIAANGAIVGHQARFFANMSRASGILSTDAVLTSDQMVQLREAVAKQSMGDNSGKVPILSNGLKFQQMSLTSQDSQMVEAMQMTVESISRVFRVPLPMINSVSDTTYANAESTMNWFLASGLGFLLEHVELELTRIFALPFSEKLNFNTKVLLRFDVKTQIDALSAGVINGIYSPNEARKQIGLGAVPDGDEPRVQQQVVPLSAWEQSMTQPAPTPPAANDEEVEAALISGIRKGMAAYD